MDFLFVIALSRANQPIADNHMSICSYSASNWHGVVRFWSNVYPLLLAVKVSRKQTLTQTLIVRANTHSGQQTGI